MKLTGYEETYSGGSYYKFGDFPQTISGISSYSSSPVCNGWYLGGDGYFYEKCTANPCTTDWSDYTCTDGTQRSARISGIAFPRKMTFSPECAILIL